MLGRQMLNWTFDDDDDDDDDDDRRSGVDSFRDFLGVLTGLGCGERIVPLSSWCCSHAVESCHITKHPGAGSVLQWIY